MCNSNKQKPPYMIEKEKVRNANLVDKLLQIELEDILGVHFKGDQLTNRSIAHVGQQKLHQVEDVAGEEDNLKDAPKPVEKEELVVEVVHRHGAQKVKGIDCTRWAETDVQALCLLGKHLRQEVVHKVISIWSLQSQSFITPSSTYHHHWVGVSQAQVMEFGIEVNGQHLVAVEQPAIVKDLVKHHHLRDKDGH